MTARANDQAQLEARRARYVQSSPISFVAPTHLVEPRGYRIARVQAKTLVKLLGRARAHVGSLPSKQPSLTCSFARTEGRVEPLHDVDRVTGAYAICEAARRSEVVVRFLTNNRY